MSSWCFYPNIKVQKKLIFSRLLYFLRSLNKEKPFFKNNLQMYWFRLCKQKSCPENERPTSSYLFKNISSIIKKALFFIFFFNLLDLGKSFHSILLGTVSFQTEKSHTNWESTRYHVIPNTSRFYYHLHMLRVYRYSRVMGMGVTERRLVYQKQKSLISNQKFRQSFPLLLSCVDNL